ncbi:unnamed protein product, partial [Rotaria magnacalcarata]
MSSSSANMKSVALADRCCQQPAQIRHHNMYLISKDHLPR